MAFGTQDTALCLQIYIQCMPLKAYYLWAQRRKIHVSYNMVSTEHFSSLFAAIAESAHFCSRMSHWAGCTSSLPFLPCPIATNPSFCYCAATKGGFGLAFYSPDRDNVLHGCFSLCLKPSVITYRFIFTGRQHLLLLLPSQPINFGGYVFLQSVVWTSFYFCVPCVGGRYVNFRRIFLCFFLPSISLWDPCVSVS